MTGALARIKSEEEKGRVPALDGLRAIFVLLVACYHFWQQSWLTPAFTLFGRVVSLDFLLRAGYFWVDGMLLLSAFCLYLPYARAAEEGKALPRAKTFYRRRFARIVPSYYLAIVIMLLFYALPKGLYANTGAMLKDIAAHLTFTQTFFPETYLHTPLNGALWTVGIEMQFYLLFPLLARAFARKPTLTYLCMTGAAFAFRVFAGTQTDTSMLVNQLPSFLDVFANGFMGASILMSLSRRLKADGKTRLLFTAVAVTCVFAALSLMRSQAGEGEMAAIRLGMMRRRYPLSVILALLMVSAGQAGTGLKVILGGRVASFLAGISYPFYVWHQVIATRLKEWGIPPSAAEKPNQAGDARWQIGYTLLCFLCALLAACAMTYLFERPVSRLLLRGEKGKKRGL